MVRLDVLLVLSVTHLAVSRDWGELAVDVWVVDLKGEDAVASEGEADRPDLVPELIERDVKAE